MRATRADAYELFHTGAIALADVERHGIRIDVDYLNDAIASVDGRINRLTAVLERDDIWSLWQKKYRHKANLGSETQLGQILFGEMGFESKAKTQRGYKTDEEALGEIDHPFVKKYLKRKKLMKAKSTYLLGIQREVVDGYLHCFFNLHTVRTFRSSSDRINMQNNPVRDPKMAKIVRSCFIARDGHQLLEIDYGALEVRGIACYCKDPTLIEYINDPSKDMHRDMASECYLIGTDDVNKMSRYCAKNQFVFPEFYGSYYLDCAKSLWESLDGHKLVDANGTPLKKRLAKQGIKRLGDQDPDSRPEPGTFEYHIKEVEERFKHKRFHVHTKWREAWWEKYKRQGYLDTLTGFRLSEVYRRNQVVNSPVQGSCFHCLLWSLIHLNKWLKKNKMRSRIVCQVHDSMLLDVHPKELDDVLTQANHISTVAIRKAWDWIIVPLVIEAELCPIGKSWFDKKGIELPL